MASKSCMETEDPDIVVGTESWLNTTITNGEIFPSKYQVFRKDRDGTDSHGGVFQAIKNTLIATEEVNLETDCEAIWASIRIQGIAPMFIGAFYRSHSTDTDYIKNLNAALAKIREHASVWLLGDINLPDVLWDQMKHRPGGRYAGPSKAMIDIAADHNLYQQITQPTRQDNILDLCLTNSPSFIVSTDVISGISDHDGVIVNISAKPKLLRPPKRKIYLYNKANTEISRLIDEFNIEILTPEYVKQSTLDHLVENFSNFLICTINQHIPSKLTSSSWKLPWINNSIKRDIYKKKRLYKKTKKTKSQTAREAFKKHRRATDRKMKKAKHDYIKDMIGGSLESNNTRPFCNFNKSKRQEVFGVSTLLTPDGDTVSSPTDKANVLNNQFSSVFTTEDLSLIPPTRDSSIPDMPNFIIHPAGVEKLLKDLNPSKASGPDAIPARVLKECASALAPVFT